MKNRTQQKTISWIHLAYDFQGDSCQAHMETSDAKSLIYHLRLENGVYQLSNVEGSHVFPVSYRYEGSLVKKILPEGRFTEVEYENGKVKFLRTPSTIGKAEITHSFAYGQDYTDVFNAMGVKTRYMYDKRFQLTAVERYDDRNHLYRIEHRFWGKTQADAGLLLARTIGDGSGRIHSYRSFQYDSCGNIVEERLCGNLTEKKKRRCKSLPTECS